MDLFCFIPIFGKEERPQRSLVQCPRSPISRLRSSVIPSPVFPLSAPIFPLLFNPYRVGQTICLFDPGFHSSLISPGVNHILPLWGKGSIRHASSLLRSWSPGCPFLLVYLAP